MLSVGSQAPDFTLCDQNGKEHSLSGYLGRKVILYFYPKDSTSGCTTQACGFRDRYPLIKEKGAVVLGISKDSIESHQKFAANNDLPFPVLSDPGCKVIQMYGVWKEKSMYGKKYMGVERSTYLIDENGIIIKALGKVKPKDNPADMLEAL